MKWIVGAHILHCNQCGAERTIPARRLSSVCPFCGSQQVIEQDALQTIEQPDGLVAFTVSEDEAKAAIRERLKGIGERIAGWFDDNRIVNAAVEGVYLPYWVFDAQVEVSRTTIDRRTSSLYENRQQIKPYQHETFNDGLIGVGIPAVTSPAPDLTAQIGAFDASAAVAYEPKLLATLSRRALRRGFRRRLAAGAERRRRSHAGALQGRRESQSYDVNVFTSVRQMSFTLLLMPVWVITLFEHDGDVRAALVNGQTGRSRWARRRRWGEGKPLIPDPSPTQAGRGRIYRPFRLREINLTPRPPLRTERVRKIALIRLESKAPDGFASSGAVALLKAERAGFEPAKVLPLLAFQASALDHYATSPEGECTAGRSYKSARTTAPQMRGIIAKADRFAYA